IKNLPVRGFQAAANLGVGIVVNNVRNLDGGTGNVNVRGGRPNETGVYIDGFQQNNLLTGIANATVPNGAVEELVVITGGFDAEYGRNQSGIITVTTKSGGQKYSGNVEAVGDPGGLGIAESYGYNVISAGFGGQVIPGNNKLRFFVSGEARNIKDAEPSVYGFPKYSLSTAGVNKDDDPASDLLLDSAIFVDKNEDGIIDFKKGARPDASTNAGINSDRGATFQGKVTYEATSKLRFDFAGNLSQTYRRSYITLRTLTNDGNLKRDILNYNIGTTATYSINPTSFLDFGVNYFYSYQTRSNDIRGNNIGNYLDYDYGNTGSRAYDYLQTGDNMLFDIGRGIVRPQRFLTNYFAFKTNYTNQIDRNNQIKIGADLFLHEVRYADVRDNLDPVQGINDYIGYKVENVGGKYKLKEVDKDDLNNMVQGAPHPFAASVYAQDKLEYEGLVLRGGLRYDVFNAGVKRIKDWADPEGQYDPDQVGQLNPATGNAQAGTLGAEDYTSAKSSHKLSPRISVSFPISEKTQFRLSYGQFYQQPNLQNLFIGPRFLYAISAQGGISAAVNNPNLQSETTIQYEVGLRRSLSEHSVIDINAFYKDIKGLVNIQSTRSVPNQLGLSTNLDEGVVQGLSISYEMRRAGKVSGRLAYTLSSARGSGSGENTNLNAAWLNFNDTKVSAPLAFDQRHVFNGNLDIRNAKGEGPEVGGQRLLENAGVNFQFNASSGLPYTPSTIVGNYIYGANRARSDGRKNSQNQPWTFRLDLKADKTIRFTDNMSMNVYVQVLNLFDRKNVILVNTATGSAHDDGYLGTAEANNLTEVQRLQYSILNYDGLNYDTPRQARLGVIFNF
ncbi:TonB-dependent receptor, partial [bacterium]|nr:TonB-dependent receptor [bacterium]